MSDMKANFEYFIAHQDELVKLHKGKFVVIKDNAVIGVFDNELEALQETSKSHKMGTFLIQRCLPGENAYTQTYHSRVIFA